MATIRAFKGYRPKPELCSKIAALPYDVMTSKEAREMVKGNPLSFLHIDRAEIDLPEEVNVYSKEVYEKARDNLDKLISESYVHDEKPVLYIYELTMNSASQTGLVVCTSIDEYLDGTIKRHELTREDKEQDRINHVDYCNANTGPIFLTYRGKETIDDIIKAEQEKEPVYDFVSEDGVGHRVWVIDNDEILNSLTEEFKEIDNFYIADGHHRNASAVKVGLKRRGDGEYDKEAEFNYYLSVLFPAEQLNILDYNRVVRDLNGFSEEEFIARIKQAFDVVSCGYAYHPEEKHTFGMYINYNWYKLKFKEKLLRSKDVIDNLDVTILQRYILTPILGIVDPRTDNRIDFIGGIRGLTELEQRVNSNEMKVAFSMHSTSMEELMQIADENKIMPPKSTWFEPKLRSGIFIHKLD